jgi:hydroxyacylglutathione hydrolase
LKVKKLILGIYSVNSYIVTLDIKPDSCFIIDRENLHPEFILNTHGHFDHLGAAPELIEKYKLPFYLHKDDGSIALDPQKNMSSLLGSNALSFKTYNLIDDKILDMLEEHDIYIYEMPGHTPGSIIIKLQNYLFTGDLLFRGAVGRTDLPGGSSKGVVIRKTEKIQSGTGSKPGTRSSFNTKKRIFK